MTTETESTYIARDDESEAARLSSFEGVGEVTFLNDEDVREYALHDMGLDLRAEDLIVPRLPKS